MPWKKKRNVGARKWRKSRRKEINRKRTKEKKAKKKKEETEVLGY